MKNEINRTAGIMIILLALILTFATAYVSSKHKNAAEQKEAALPGKQYVCSMHPQIVQDTPGDCPICGMFLIEKIADDNNRVDSSLNDVVRHVNESVLASAATVKPLLLSMPLTIEANGIFTCDPRSIKTVSARFSGIIERSFIKYQFQPVHEGQKIFQIYCPEIYIQRWNYVKLIQAYPDKDNLTTEARNWFRLIGLTDGQVDSLKRASKPDYHLNVYSDAEGFAVGPDFNPDSFFLSGAEGGNSGSVYASGGRSLEVRDGSSLEKGQSLFKVIDPKALRADLKVRTEDVRLFRPGQKVTLTDDEIKGVVLTGTVGQIEPLNGGLFQLLKVYIRNTSGGILPGRQIRGQVTTSDHEALWLPETAIINLGHRQSVFVMQNGKFIATTVYTGMTYNHRIEILSGVDASSEIALNGLLLIDSDGLIN